MPSVTRKETMIGVVNAGSFRQAERIAQIELARQMAEKVAARLAEQRQAEAQKAEQEAARLAEQRQAEAQKRADEWHNKMVIAAEKADNARKIVPDT